MTDLSKIINEFDNLSIIGELDILSSRLSNSNPISDKEFIDYLKSLEFSNNELYTDVSVNKLKELSVACVYWQGVINLIDYFKWGNSVERLLTDNTFHIAELAINPLQNLGSRLINYQANLSKSIHSEKCKSLTYKSSPEYQALNDKINSLKDKLKNTTDEREKLNIEMEILHFTTDSLELEGSAIIKSTQVFNESEKKEKELESIINDRKNSFLNEEDIVYSKIKALDKSANDSYKKAKSLIKKNVNSALGAYADYVRKTAELIDLRIYAQVRIDEFNHNIFLHDNKASKNYEKLNKKYDDSYPIRENITLKEIPYK